MYKKIWIKVDQAALTVQLLNSGIPFYTSFMAF